MPAGLLGRGTGSTQGLAGSSLALNQSGGDYGQEEVQDCEGGEASSYEEMQDCPPPYSQVVRTEEGCHSLGPETFV